MRASPEELRQQLWEVEASLRVAVDSSDAAARVASAVHRIDLFFRDVHDAADELQLGVELVVQALLSKLAEKQAFDQQGGSKGNAIPMHQNKVLDRSKRVLTMDADRVKDAKWIAKQINENLPKLLEALVLLRENVKIKVEDACDIAMARKWATMARGFFDVLKEMACGHNDLYAAWCAVQSGNIPEFAKAEAAAEDAHAATLGDLTLLHSLTADFKLRVDVLASVSGLADDAALNDAGTALQIGLRAQLKDSRGQVIKAACEAVRRVARIESWPVMAKEVVAALVARLHVSNKALGKELADTLTEVVTHHPTSEVLVDLISTVESTPLAVTQAKTAETLLSWVEAAKPEAPDAALLAAAKACVASRHPAARTAGKALLAACVSLWPNAAPPSPERKASPAKKKPAGSRLRKFARPPPAAAQEGCAVMVAAPRNPAAGAAVEAPACDENDAVAATPGDRGTRSRSVPRGEGTPASPPSKRSKVGSSPDDATAPMAELPTNVVLPRLSSDAVKASPGANHQRKHTTASPSPLSQTADAQ